MHAQLYTSQWANKGGVARLPEYFLQADTVRFHRKKNINNPKEKKIR